MKKSEELISELYDLTLSNKKKVNEWRDYGEEVLNYRAIAKSWSALECLEHLNRYGDFYLPEIRKSIEQSIYPASDSFKSGWLGGYFANSMWPKEKLNKMKTFPSMNPLGSKLDLIVLKKFIEQQDDLLDLLERAKNTDLQKVKTAVSISKWIKLRLGDTFKVLVYHNYRHVLQAERATIAKLSK